MNESNCSCNNNNKSNGEVKCEILSAAFSVKMRRKVFHFTTVLLFPYYLEILSAAFSENAAESISLLRSTIVVAGTGHLSLSFDDNT